MTSPLIPLTGGMLCVDDSCTIPTPTKLGRPTIGEIMTNGTTTPDFVVTVEERFAILDAVYRYATGIDTRDWDLFRTAFTDDAVVDFGFASWPDGDSFTTFMRETHEPAGRTLHRMSNTVAMRTATGELTARTYGDAVVLQADNVTGTIANAWYSDTFVPVDGGYRISRRTVHMISMRTIGPNLAATM
jgi:3-phenylpropionate/cinnamic acid dioxygenase small subunit